MWVTKQIGVHCSPYHTASLMTTKHSTLQQLHGMIQSNQGRHSAQLRTTHWQVCLFQLGLMFSLHLALLRIRPCPPKASQTLRNMHVTF
jgi:hypothetical protein